MILTFNIVKECTTLNKLREPERHINDNAAKSDDRAMIPLQRVMA